MNRQEGRSGFPLPQKAFLGGLLRLEELMRAFENPQLKVSRRTLLAGGGGVVALLVGLGVWVNRQGLEVDKKKEPELVLDPDQEIFNERLGLVFSNTTKRPIAFFPQRLENFLAEERLTLPLPIKIGFLFKENPQPQAIKRANLTFYFNLQDPTHQNSDLELALSGHIFVLVDFVSKVNWESIPQNAFGSTNGFALVASPETPLGNSYQGIIEKLKTGQLQPLFTPQR